MPDDPILPTPAPNPGPTPTGYQRTQGGSFKWVPPTAEELSKLLPQYEVERLAGRGGMGAVYKGKQKVLDRSVAIKILPPEVDAEDDSYTTRFKNEAKIMAKLEHPAIVPVYDFGETSTGLLYFVMSFVDGTDVHQMIQSQGRLPPEHALAITAHVCDALAYAHRNGVIHRDIKPSNVLLNMDGQVKVADFGLAKVDDPSQSSGLTKTGLAMGTPDYVAPETLTMGMQVDGRADLYAVGVMLYQMLTGRVPRGTFDAPSKLTGCDPRFDAIAFKAMKYDREERYDCAGDLRKDLDVILTAPLIQHGGQSSAAIPQNALPPDRRTSVAKPARQVHEVAKGNAKAGANAPAAGRADATPGLRQTPAATKSKRPLFISIGAVAAIAVGAFVMMGGGDKAKQSGPLSPLSGTSVPSASDSAQGTVRTTLPATPIKVREEPKPAVAAPISNPQSSLSNAAPPAFPPGKWVKVFTKLEDLPAYLRAPEKGVKFEDGWIRVTGEDRRLPIHLPAELGSNCAVRARIVRGATTEEYRSIALRGNADPKHLYSLALRSDLVCSATQEAEVLNIFKVAPPAPINAGDEYTMEFAAIGDRLIGRLNSKLIKIASDSRLRSGNAYVSGAEPIRDIEVINLDGIPEAEALKILGVDEKGNDLRKPAVASSNLKSPILNPASASPSPPATSTAPISNSKSSISNAAPAAFPPGQWVKVFTKTEDLPPSEVHAGAKVEDGWVTGIQGMTRLTLPQELQRNYGIRATYRKLSDNSTLGRLILRRNPDPARTMPYVSFGLGGNASQSTVSSLVLQTSKDSKNFTSIWNEGLSQSIKAGDTYTLEFGMVESTAVTRFGNSNFRVSQVDAATEGGCVIGGLEPARDIEVINLDGIPESEALRILGVDEKGNDLRALAAKQEQQQKVQAEQQSGIDAIPELKTLHEQFVKLQAERVSAPFEADVAKLNTGYLGGLDREIEKEKKAGHLDGVLVLEAEKKLVASIGNRSQSADGLRVPLEATANPLPAEDDDATPANLKALRKIYRDTFAKHEATRAANLKLLTDPLTLRLKQLESTLTQKNRIEHAKVVREYREGLGRSTSYPTRGPEPGGAAATTNDTDKNARATKKFPPGDDRKAAEWAINLGGWVKILEGKNERRINKKEDLPKRSFDVVALKLSSQPTSKPVIDYTDLTPIAGLRQLNDIDFAGMPVTDADCDVLASLPELARLTISKTDTFTGSQLGKLKHLGKLTYLYLGETGITAEGVASISELIDLEYLRLTPTKFGDTEVAPLVKLKKLSSLLMGRGQLTLDGWKKLKGLFIKDYLGFTPQAGQIQTWCAELARLFPSAHHLEVACDDAFTAEDIVALGKLTPTRLTFSNANMNDTVIAALSQFSKLEYLNLASGPKGSGLAGVTDASLTALAEHKNLSLISLNDARGITADGFLKLARLKTLKTLELIRCRQLDAATIDAMKKTRPDVKVSVE